MFIVPFWTCEMKHRQYWYEKIHSELEHFQVTASHDGVEESLIDSQAPGTRYRHPNHTVTNKLLSMAAELCFETPTELIFRSSTLGH